MRTWQPLADRQRRPLVHRHRARIRAQGSPALHVTGLGSPLLLGGWLFVLGDPGSLEGDVPSCLEITLSESVEGVLTILIQLRINTGQNVVKR